MIGLCAKWGESDKGISLVNHGLGSNEWTLRDDMPDEDIRVMLARMDERTRQMALEQKDFRDQLRANYVTKTELAPIRYIVYGLVVTVLSAVLWMILVNAGIDKP